MCRPFKFYFFFISILRRSHKRRQGFPYKIPKLKISNTLNPDILKSPQKNIKSPKWLFLQSKYRVKYYSFEISRECHFKENFFAKNHTSRDRKCFFWYFVKWKFSYRQKYTSFFKSDFYCTLLKGNLFIVFIKFRIFSWDFEIVGILSMSGFWVFGILGECRWQGLVYHIWDIYIWTIPRKNVITKLRYFGILEIFWDILR